ncbi:MAG TPA: sensor histidine kinase, partial [Candidatus Limiplasma sp.]|nr:sensor histidine kinase [Candidatus Limiplasma sp.]
VLNSYIYIQRVRFKDFRVEYDIAEDTWDLHIGRFILQPFVENSILHGLRGMQEEGVIRIVTRRDDALRIEIHDNGQGFDPLAVDPPKPDNRFSDHIGIGNVRERIRLHYGEQYGAEIESGPGQGTVVYLILPVIGHKEERS